MPDYSYVEMNGKKTNLGNKACLSWMRSDFELSRYRKEKIDYVECKLKNTQSLSVQKWMTFLKGCSFFKDNLIFYNGECILPRDFSYQECVFVYSAARYIIEYRDRANKIISFHDDLGLPKEMAFIMGHYYGYDTGRKQFNKIFFSNGHSAMPNHPFPKYFTDALNKTAGIVRENYKPWRFETPFRYVYHIVSNAGPGGEHVKFPQCIPFDGEITKQMKGLFGCKQ